MVSDRCVSPAFGGEHGSLQNEPNLWKAGVPARLRRVGANWRWNAYSENEPNFWVWISGWAGLAVEDRASAGLEPGWGGVREPGVGDESAFLQNEPKFWVWIAESADWIVEN